MGLSWQTGPLSRGAIGLFFVPGPLPKRLLYASRCAGACACASAEPGSPIARMSSCRSNLCRCPVAYFAETDVSSDTYTAPSKLPGIPTSVSPSGTPSEWASRPHRAGRGYRPTRASCWRGSRSPGKPWTPSTKKTNGSKRGILALCIGKFRRFFRASALALFSENNGENDMATERDKEHGKRHLVMNKPPIVSQQEWEAARQQLLVKEKALTRSRDALAAERRRMPWMAVEKAYAFEGPRARLACSTCSRG